MARRPWEELSANYRRRLLRAGVTPETYGQGVSLKEARGHKTTPERPQRAYAKPDLFGDYLRRRRDAGKPLPPGLIPSKEDEERQEGGGWGGQPHDFGYPNESNVGRITMFRTQGGSASGNTNAYLVIEISPRGDIVRSEVYEYNEAEFTTLIARFKREGWVVKVESGDALGMRLTA